MWDSLQVKLLWDISLFKYGFLSTWCWSDLSRMDNAILRLFCFWSCYHVTVSDSQVHLEHQAFLCAMLSDSDNAILKLFVTGLVIIWQFLLCQYDSQVNWTPEFVRAMLQHTLIMQAIRDHCKSSCYETFPYLSMVFWAPDVGAI